MQTHLLAASLSPVMSSLPDMGDRDTFTKRNLCNVFRQIRERQRIFLLLVC